MSIPQTIIDIAAVCKQHGISQLITCPGSRNAPLSLTFSRHPGIQTWVIPDERAAAYIALGMAQQQNQPVILLCTSGTAALNFGPAVAEAFYQKVPLLVFTADRPPEWIDQNDGQSIRQRNLFESHIVKSFQLPVDLTHADSQWQVNRTINEAILSTESGPVHINAPFREPLYPNPNVEWGYNEQVRVIKRSNPSVNLSHEKWQQIIAEWENAEKVLVVGGQGRVSELLIDSLERLIKITSITVLGDVVSNLHKVSGAVKRAELFLAADGEDLNELKPDLLISFNHAVVSKNLKKFLRKHRAPRHWHIQPEGIPPDTFQGLTEILPLAPETFFGELVKRTPAAKGSEYRGLYQQMEQRSDQLMDSLLKNQSFNELKATSRILPAIGPVKLHLSNSTPVRLADMVGIPSLINQVYCNRGTSGIDGCTSTAVGHSLADARLNILITGDMAFFYDRNALWHNYKLPNLKIILLNNHGGGIFRLIDGPRQQPELEQLFVTHQALTARNTAADFNLKYLYCNQSDQLDMKLRELLEPNDHVSLLEIEFSEHWADFYQELKRELKNNL